MSPIIKQTIFASCLLLFSCQSSKQPNVLDKSTPIILSSSFDNIKSDDLFKSSRVVALETTPEATLGKIQKILWDDEKFFVLDQRKQKIAVFDKAGKVQHVIERAGRGPGEYGRISDATLDRRKKQIVILSDNGSLIRLHYDGRFIDETKRTQCFAYEIAMIDTSLAVIHQYNDHPKYLSMINHQGEIMNTLMTHPELPNNNYYPVGSFITQTGKGKITARFDYSIYSFDKGVINKEYTIDFKELQLPEELLLPEAPPKQLDQVCKDNQYVYTLYNVVEHNSVLLFKTNLSGFFVYDKVSKNLNNYRFLYDGARKLSYNSLIPIQGKEDCVAFMVNASTIYTSNQLRKKHALPGERIELREFEGVRENDNPILIIYQFR